MFRLPTVTLDIPLIELPRFFAPETSLAGLSDVCRATLGDSTCRRIEPAQERIVDGNLNHLGGRSPSHVVRFHNVLWNSYHIDLWPVKGADAAFACTPPVEVVKRTGQLSDQPARWLSLRGFSGLCPRLARHRSRINQLARSSFSLRPPRCATNFDGHRFVARVAPGPRSPHRAARCRC